MRYIIGVLAFVGHIMNILLNKAPITLPTKLNWKSMLCLKAIQFTIKFQLNWLSFQAGETCPILLETP